MESLIKLCLDQGVSLWEAEHMAHWMAEDKTFFNEFIELENKKDFHSMARLGLILHDRMVKYETIMETLKGAFFQILRQNHTL